MTNRSKDVERIGEENLEFVPISRSRSALPLQRWDAGMLEVLSHHNAARRLKPCNIGINVTKQKGRWWLANVLNEEGDHC